MPSSQKLTSPGVQDEAEFLASLTGFVSRVTAGSAAGRGLFCLGSILKLGSRICDGKVAALFPVGGAMNQSQLRLACTRFCLGVCAHEWRSLWWLNFPFFPHAHVPDKEGCISVVISRLALSGGFRLQPGSDAGRKKKTYFGARARRG